MEAADFADSGDFKIDQNGVLSFMASPDFEVPATPSTQTTITESPSRPPMETTTAISRCTSSNQRGRDREGNLDVDPAGNPVTIPATVCTAAVPARCRTDRQRDRSRRRRRQLLLLMILRRKWYRSSSRSATGNGDSWPAAEPASYTVTDSDVGMHIRVTWQPTRTAVAPRRV